MNFTDYHCLLLTAAYRETGRQLGESHPPPPAPRPPPALPNHEKYQQSWFGFRRLTVFRFNIKQTCCGRSPMVITLPAEIWWIRSTSQLCFCTVREQRCGGASACDSLREEMLSKRSVWPDSRCSALVSFHYKQKHTETSS